VTVVTQRIQAGIRRRRELRRLRGDAVECPCCGTRLRAFAPDWNRPRAICPRCGSHERHRALALYLRRTPRLLDPGTRWLHFAPEYALERLLRAAPGIRYLTTDLEPGAADVAADVTALPFEDGAFDVVLCSHVLEHVEDDVAAIRELARVTRPGGTAIVLVPIDHGRARTYEDPSIVDPGERERAFWQHDHVRLYGRDFPDRLRAGDLDVEALRMSEWAGPDAVGRHGLLPDEEIYLAHPRG
jgi:SAM-dependent methyltransferase